MAALTVVEPRVVPAANENRVEAADEVDMFVRVFPVQDDEAIEFCSVRVIAWGLKTNLANYARLVRNLNLELATPFRNFAGISATPTVSWAAHTATPLHRT